MTRIGHDPIMTLEKEIGAWAKNAATRGRCSLSTGTLVYGRPDSVPVINRVAAQALKALHHSNVTVDLRGLSSIPDWVTSFSETAVAVSLLLPQQRQDFTEQSKSTKHPELKEVPCGVTQRRFVHPTTLSCLPVLTVRQNAAVQDSARRDLLSAGGKENHKSGAATTRKTTGSSHGPRDRSWWNASNQASIGQAIGKALQPIKRLQENQTPEVPYEQPQNLDRAGQTRSVSYRTPRDQEPHAPTGSSVRLESISRCTPEEKESPGVPHDEILSPDPLVAPWPSPQPGTVSCSTAGADKGLSASNRKPPNTPSESPIVAPPPSQRGSSRRPVAKAGRGESSVSVRPIAPYSSPAGDGKSQSARKVTWRKGDSALAKRKGDSALANTPQRDAQGLFGGSPPWVRRGGSQELSLRPADQGEGV